MANFKLTISDKKGKSITKELKEGDANPFVSLTIGSQVDAATVGLSGKLKVTGGSDKSGVPMRADIHSGSRKYVLLSKGVGLNDAERGERIRKLIRGNTISEEIYQINCSYDGEIKVEKEPEATTEEPTQEAPKKDDSAKKEVKDAPKKDDSAKKEVKDAPKKDDSAKKEVKDAPKKDDSAKKEVKDAPKKDDSAKKEVKKEAKKA